MAIELVRAMPEHIPQMARITYEAFKGIADAHNFPTDIPDVNVASMFIEMLVTRPDFYGVAAVEDGVVLGHNFVQISDPVAAVGPICVEPNRQAKGVGRHLMQHIVEWSLKNHGPMVRLLQEGYNMRSLSLYAALGFVVREPVVLMEVIPASKPDSTTRALTAADLDACDALCQKVQKASRKNELAAAIQFGPAMGCVPFGRFVGGPLKAFIVPGFFGFSAAVSDDELLDVMQEAARLSPPPLHRTLMPTRQGTLFPAAMRRGFRSIKPFNTMSIGPYETPRGAWTPSIGY
nr:Acetyltransferase (GNAT) family [uncultured bacterium]